MKINKLALISLTTIFSTTLLTPTYAEKNNETYRTYKDIIKEDPDSSYLFLFVFRSTAYLDWSAPSKLAVTTLKSQIATKLFKDASSIGHAQIAWYCNNKGDISQGATGQTGQHGNEGFQVVKTGWGLSVLDTVFLDGYLESEAEVAERIEIGDKHNNFAWLAIKTKSDNCVNLNNFVKAYDKSGNAKNYGFPVDPLKYEGAGCTSFANAAFTRSELNIPLSKAWVRKVNIPLNYMGKLKYEIKGTKALELAKSSEDEKIIPITGFMFKDIQWAKDSEPHKDFYYYDPELFYESLVHLENSYRIDGEMRIKNPIRTTQYDRFQKNAKKVAENWYRELSDSDKKIKMTKIYNTTGLIIEY